MRVGRKELAALLDVLNVAGAGEWDAATMAAKVNRDDGVVKYRDAGDVIADPTLSALYDQIAAAQAAGDLVEVHDDAPETFPLAGGDETPGERLDRRVRDEVTPFPAKKSRKAANKAANKAARKSGAKPPASKTVASRTVVIPAGRPAKKPGAKPAKTSRYDGHPSFAAWVKYLAKNPKELPDKDTILGTTVAELRAAGKGKNPRGISKDELLGVLKDKFPEHGRHPDKMMRNLNNNVPGRLRWMYGVRVSKTKGAGGVTCYYIAGDGKSPPARPAKKSRETAGV